MEAKTMHLSHSSPGNGGSLATGRQGKWRLGLVAPVVALVASLFPGPAQANHGFGPETNNLECSTVIDDSDPNPYVLSHDIGPCDSGGLIVRRNDSPSDPPYTIDLNGHDIYGTPAYGDRAGIWLDHEYNITVTNNSTVAPTGSEIYDFDGGVEIWGGGNNKVQKLIIRDNIGTETLATRWSEGVGIWRSSDNVVCNNLIKHNGIYGGVVLYSHSGPPGVTTPPSNNKIGDPACGAKAGTAGQNAAGDGGNEITKNDVNRLTTNEAVGVRLELWANNNTVENNRVEYNGLDGISVFRAPLRATSPTYTQGNVIKNNIVRFNGCHENTVDSNKRLGEIPPSSDCGAGTTVDWDQFVNQRKGDGIRIHGHPGFNQNAINNTVEGNEVCGNAASGIRVDGGDFSATSTSAGTNPGHKNTVQNNFSGAPKPPSTTPCPLNVRVPQATNPSYDLLDTNDAPSNYHCNANTWTSNTTGTGGTRRANDSVWPTDACTIG